MAILWHRFRYLCMKTSKNLVSYLSSLWYFGLSEDFLQKRYLKMEKICQRIWNWDLFIFNMYANIQQNFNSHLLNLIYLILYYCPFLIFNFPFNIQIALLAAQQSVNMESSSQDNMIHDRLQNLQRFYDTRDQVCSISYSHNRFLFMVVQNLHT